MSMSAMCPPTAPGTPMAASVAMPRGAQPGRRDPPSAKPIRWGYFPS